MLWKGVVDLLFNEPAENERRSHDLQANWTYNLVKMIYKNVTLKLRFFVLKLGRKYHEYYFIIKLSIIFGMLLRLLVEPGSSGWEAGITRNNNRNSIEKLLIFPPYKLKILFLVSSDTS